MVAAGTHTVKHRARSISIWAAALSAGGFVSPVLGGLVTKIKFGSDAEASWRWGFIAVGAGDLWMSRIPAADLSIPPVIVPLVLIGIGFGFGFALTAVAVNTVPNGGAGPARPRRTRRRHAHYPGIPGRRVRKAIP